MLATFLFCAGRLIFLFKSQHLHFEISATSFLCRPTCLPFLDVSHFLSVPADSPSFLRFQPPMSATSFLRSLSVSILGSLSVPFLGSLSVPFLGSLSVPFLGYCQYPFLDICQCPFWDVCHLLFGMFVIYVFGRTWVLFWSYLNFLFRMLSFTVLSLPKPHIQDSHDPNTVSPFFPLPYYIDKLQSVPMARHVTSLQAYLWHATSACWGLCPQTPPAH